MRLVGSKSTLMMETDLISRTLVYSISCVINIRGSVVSIYLFGRSRVWFLAQVPRFHVVLLSTYRQKHIKINSNWIHKHLRQEAPYTDYFCPSFYLFRDSDEKRPCATRCAVLQSCYWQCVVFTTSSFAFMGPEISYAMHNYGQADTAHYCQVVGRYDANRNVPPPLPSLINTWTWELHDALRQKHEYTARLLNARVTV